MPDFDEPALRRALAAQGRDVLIERVVRLEREAGRVAVARVDLLEALKSVRATLCFHVRDHAARAADAWVYGVMVGWLESDDGADALTEVAIRHRWPMPEVERLQRYHAAIARLLDSEWASSAPPHHRDPNRPPVPGPHSNPAADDEG